MEHIDTAATKTFCSQTELIMEVAVESAVSVLQHRLGQEGADSDERRVRTDIHIQINVVFEKKED